MPRRAGQLATFGIVASTPETGYGYIQRGAQSAAGVYRIARFVEKPDAARAREFVAAGNYYWNSGMFLFRARRYLQELERFGARDGPHLRERLSQRAGGPGLHAHRCGGI